MASKKQRSNGTWEYCFQKKGLLDRTWLTFDSEDEGDRFAARMEELLGRGVLPPELAGGRLAKFKELLNLYEISNAIVDSDLQVLSTITRSIGLRDLSAFNYPWVEAWVKEMQAEGLAPSTLIKRVGSLARCVDWGIRSGKLSLPNNPLRLLPRGYATKGRVEKERSWAGERDRRLHEGEEQRIRGVLSPTEELLFDMALETAMRLREIYTLSCSQIDLDRRTIFLDKTKNGSKRQVPISSTLLRKLSFVREADGFVFPYWQGSLDKRELEKCSNKLSRMFANRFEKAGSPDLHFHDLRHEATSRLFERTNLRDTEIASITGHKDLRMLQRYANLRASTLVDRMW